MDIFYIKQNIRGAWVICGRLGIRQYYYYTKQEAIEKYKQELKEKLFEVERVGKTKANN